MLSRIVFAALCAAPLFAQPNIVVILADDLGCCDMAIYEGWVKTPRIEQMAKEGMLFTDFHTNGDIDTNGDANTLCAGQQWIGEFAHRARVSISVGGTTGR